MEDIKFLALVLVGLFVIFLVSGSITGGAIWSRVATVQKTATVPTSTVKSVDTTGTGCVKLDYKQCNEICGTGIVYSGIDCSADCLFRCNMDWSWDPQSVKACRSGCGCKD